MPQNVQPGPSDHVQGASGALASGSGAPALLAPSSDVSPVLAPQATEQANVIASDSANRMSEA